jgi:hypothetical protein
MAKPVIHGQVKPISSSRSLCNAGRLTAPGRRSLRQDVAVARDEEEVDGFANNNRQRPLIIHLKLRGKQPQPLDAASWRRRDAAGLL